MDPTGGINFYYRNDSAASSPLEKGRAGKNPKELKMATEIFSSTEPSKNNLPNAELKPRDVRSEREIMVECIMREKGVSQEVAEAEYDAFS